MRRVHYSVGPIVVEWVTVDAHLPYRVRLLAGTCLLSEHRLATEAEADATARGMVSAIHWGGNISRAVESAYAPGPMRGAA
jgi:hypothetical protein